MAQIRWADAGYSATTVTLTTTSETVIIQTPSMPIIAAGIRAIILAWAQLTTGSSTATVTPRIRRGAGLSGTPVGVANAMSAIGTPPATAGYILMGIDAPPAGDEVIYTFTLQQGSATANGSAIQAAILVYQL